MRKKIYLINPATDFPNYFGTEVYAQWGLPPKIYSADQSITTVAAMASSYLDIALCDEGAQVIDFNTACDYIGITGKVSQWARMRAIAAEFRKRGKRVIIGGPFASLCPDVVRPHCDIIPHYRALTSPRKDIHPVIPPLPPWGEGNFINQFLQGEVRTGTWGI